MMARLQARPDTVRHRLPSQIAIAQDFVTSRVSQPATEVLALLSLQTHNLDWANTTGASSGFGYKLRKSLLVLFLTTMQAAADTDTAKLRKTHASRNGGEKRKYVYSWGTGQHTDQVAAMRQN